MHAVASVLVGYPAEGGDAVRVEVRLQRLKIDGDVAWRCATWMIRLLAEGSKMPVP